MMIILDFRKLRPPLIKKTEFVSNFKIFYLCIRAVYEVRLLKSLGQSEFFFFYVLLHYAKLVSI